MSGRAFSDNPLTHWRRRKSGKDISSIQPSQDIFFKMSRRRILVALIMLVQHFLPPLLSFFSLSSPFLRLPLDFVLFSFSSSLISSSTVPPSHYFLLRNSQTYPSRHKPTSD